MNEADLRRLAERACGCGYLSTGVIPPRLCFDCGDRALADWLAEERSLLVRVPAYASDVAEVLRETAQRQKHAIMARSNEPSAEAQWERDKGARRLSKLGRRHRVGLAILSQDRWLANSSLVGLDPREQLRRDARRFTKRGLGAAGLTVLGLDAVGILVNKLRDGR